MGEDGKGSLEPGVASGDVFVMAYPTPFCEYYWYANRAELDDEKRKMLFPDAEQGGASTGVAADGAALAEGCAERRENKRESSRHARRSIKKHKLESDIPPCVYI